MTDIQLPEVTFNNQDIIKILQQYKNKKECEHNRYHNVLKHNSEFKIINNNRSKEYYNNNKDKIKDGYQEKKEMKNAKSLFRYYKTNGIIHLFTVKHSDKVKYIPELQ